MGSYVAETEAFDARLVFGSEPEFSGAFPVDVSACPPAHRHAARGSRRGECHAVPVPPCALHPPHPLRAPPAQAPYGLTTSAYPVGNPTMRVNAPEADPFEVGGAGGPGKVVHTCAGLAPLCCMSGGGRRRALHLLAAVHVRMQTDSANQRRPARRPPVPTCPRPATPQRYPDAGAPPANCSVIEVLVAGWPFLVMFTTAEVASGGRRVRSPVRSPNRAPAGRGQRVGCGCLAQCARPPPARSWRSAAPMLVTSLVLHILCVPQARTCGTTTARTTGNWCGRLGAHCSAHVHCTRLERGRGQQRPRRASPAGPRGARPCA